MQGSFFIGGGEKESGMKKDEPFWIRKKNGEDAKGNCLHP